MSEKRIILNKYKTVDSENKNISTLLDLRNDKNIIRENEFNEIVNEYNIYLDERESCNTIRLTAQVNLMASNILFNSVTEIVKNEDSDECECLNFTPKKISSSYAKQNLLWGEDINECIQDTQITYDGDVTKNYTYHCGIDIFDNHVLRSKTTIPNYYNINESDNTFNTINDFLMDSDGKEWVSSSNDTQYKYISKNPEKEGYFTRLEANRHSKRMHLYNKSNIFSFIDSINTKLIDKNGWVGFLNKSKMDSYDSNGNNFGISRVINNKSVNAFIELYPGKSHYSIMPYYNKARHRQEKNWEYCLTYPSSSTNTGIPCINEKLNTLKIAFIDESEIDDDDLLKTVIHSSCKHGLIADDIINIYKSTYTNDKHELYEENVVVDSVVDEYTFVVYLADYTCKNWISVFDEEQINNVFVKHTGVEKYYPKSQYLGPEYVTSFNNYINADFDTSDNIGSQNLSFARVVNNKQVKYYVRIFSRFPNFDFMDLEATEENIYGSYNGTRLNIDEYSKLEYEKTSTLTKLGFAKNVYGDDMAQIVFNDDINISGIKDNLGRPLTSLYLSFFKTNYGRKEWYDGNVGSKKVEHSHCFGKLNCGLELNPMINNDEFNAGNTRLMNNIDDGFGGLPQLQLRQQLSWLDDDEISYNDQDKFYGDLCEYSTVNCLERVIQPIIHRFNTQQRELESTTFAKKTSFHAVTYHEIYRDDVTSNGVFTTTESVYDASVISKKDGYTYISNYEIPIRTFSGQLSEFIPKSYKLSSLECDNNKTYTAITSTENYVNHDSDLVLYDLSNNITYKCNVKNILTPNSLIFTLHDKNGNIVSVNTDDLTNYRIYKKPVGIPSYATIADDGSGKYRWRNLVQNGFEDNDDAIEEYPYTNGCLYVNKLINIFVRRQDPFGLYGLATMTGISSIDGKQSSVEFNDSYSDNNSDDSISENNATC